MSIDRDTAPGPGVFPGESYTRMDCQHNTPSSPTPTTLLPPLPPPPSIAILINKFQYARTNRKTDFLSATSRRKKSHDVSAVGKSCLVCYRCRMVAAMTIVLRKSTSLSLPLFADERAAMEEGVRFHPGRRPPRMERTRCRVYTSLARAQGIK